MTQAPSPEIPAPMEGHGAYNRSSRVQAAGIAATLPLLEQTARTVPIESSGRAVVIADYGSSQGHNSLPPIAAAIGVLRAPGPEPRHLGRAYGPARQRLQRAVPRSGG